MTDDNKMTDAALEALFEDARAQIPTAPDGLMKRVLSDADAVQPAAIRPGWRTRLAGLGGLPGLGGLITASCVGFWLGVSPPVGLPDLAGEVLGIETLIDEDIESATMTGFGWDVEEG